MAGLKHIKQGIATRKAITKFIATYIRKNGVSPTLQEIAEGVGLASHNAVRAHLVRMRDAGEVTWVEGSVRTLRLTPKATPKASKRAS